MAVRIPEYSSCYHMFGGKMGVHQTSVPVILGDYVTVQEKDIFIFAWGGGGPKSSSSK